jgi:hypothetical protein
LFTAWTPSVVPTLITPTNQWSSDPEPIQHFLRHAGRPAGVFRNSYEDTITDVLVGAHIPVDPTNNTLRHALVALS